MTEPAKLSAAFAPGGVAVVTGAASGIGLASARRLAGRGMKVVLADLGGGALERAAEAVATASPAGPADVLAMATDVSRRGDLTALRDAAEARFGAVSVLMNNAGISPNPGAPWSDSTGWKALLDVNLWGVIHGVEAFAPGMIASGQPAAIINTGSKQGITNPPGNAAYNMSKAAVRSYTESLAHALLAASEGRMSAHLLIPGYTYTGLTKASEKPASAWTGEQVADFMLASIAAGDFYILCPDNAVDRARDEKRMQWSMDDIIRNRPALSRWHPDFEKAFAAYIDG